jgi:hypothetical protein
MEEEDTLYTLWQQTIGNDSKTDTHSLRDSFFCLFSLFYFLLLFNSSTPPPNIYFIWLPTRFFHLRISSVSTSTNICSQALDQALLKTISFAAHAGPGLCDRQD